MNNRVSGLGWTYFGAGFGLIDWAKGVVLGVEVTIWAYVGGTGVCDSLDLEAGFVVVWMVCSSVIGTKRGWLVVFTGLIPLM